MFGHFAQCVEDTVLPASWLRYWDVLLLLLVLLWLAIGPRGGPCYVPMVVRA